MNETSAVSAELIATMAVVAAGAMLGRIECRGVRLDVAAMLLVGATVAHYGITLSPALGLFGLLLFLYAVGVKTGPALRRMHRREVKLGLVALGMVLALLAASLGLGRLLGLPSAVTLGSFCGFFGSGAALALLEGVGNPGQASAGFAVAAPLSSLLVMLLVQAWRARAVSAVALEVDEWNRTMARSPKRPAVAEIVVERLDAVERPLSELRLHCPILWVRRRGESFAATPETRLSLGDVLHVSAEPSALAHAAERLGRTMAADAAPEPGPVVVGKFLVTSPKAIGVRLDRLVLRERYGATVTRIRRAGLDLRARAGLRFRWGDRVQLSVPRDGLESLRQLFGDDARGFEELAFPRAALVIFAGGMLGAMTIPLGSQASLRLGPALGVFLVSLLTAALHRTGPMVWTQSGPTTRLMSQLGLPMFLAQVGNESYPRLVSAWGSYGAELIALAVAPVALVGLLAYLAARLFHYGTLTVLSLIPSVALNTPALTTLQSRYRERIPAHVYAAVYPVTVLGLLTIVFVLSLAR